MAGKVTGSQSAQSEVMALEADFRGGIADLRSKFARHNAVLTNPMEWDGPHANAYSSQIVPEINALLSKWDNDVSTLTTNIRSILGHILTAGGD